MSANPNAPVSTDLHVVCVDDDVEFLKSLEFFLPEQVNGGSPQQRYDFLFFGNASEALEALRELVDEGRGVAMLISDQQMPGMKGTEFLARSREICADSVRVLLTGYAGIESAITAINENLLDKYLTKPIENEHDFTLSVRHLLHRWEMQKRLARQTATLSELYRFSNTLNGMGNVDDTVEVLARFTQQALNAQRVGVCLPRDGMLRELAHAGPADPADGPFELPPRFAAASGARVAGGVDELRQRGLIPISGIPGATAPALVAALTSGPEFLGLLTVRGSAPCGEWERELLETIASTASIAVHNQVNRANLEVAYETTREQATELEEANQRLHLLDRLKSDFLSFISHELRTPLSGLSAIDLIDETMTGAELQSVVGAVRGSYVRLNDFIMKGLQYFEWLASPPRPGLTDLAGIVRSVLATTVRPEGTPPPVASLPAEPVRVPMDVAELERIVRTLVDNGVKFSDGRGVQVRVEVTAAGARLEVEDQGRGFAPELGDELFRPFTIANTLNHHRGSGLNLATAAVILEKHGGRISASSAGPNRGATFTVEFGGDEPLAAAA